MEILRSDSNQSLILNANNTFNTNANWEDNISQYENEVLLSVINPKTNYETDRFRNEPYSSSNGIVQDDIWMFFYFYSDSGNTHYGGLNYEYAGLSLTDNSKLTINTSESFFRLDFYKIPENSGGTLDYFNKRLVFTKNLKIPLGEKVFYKPINNYIYVPVFMGSSFRNSENMDVFWFTDDTVLADSTLTGNSFFMTAKYYNSIDGSITNFGTISAPASDVIDESNEYFNVNLNKSNNTYYVSGNTRIGTSINPIKFYANTTPNIEYSKYIPPLNVTITYSTVIDTEPNNGYININVSDGIPNYTYNLYSGNTVLVKSVTTSDNAYQFTGLTECIKYVVRIIDGEDKFYLSSSIYLECSQFIYTAVPIIVPTQLNL